MTRIEDHNWSMNNQRMCIGKRFAELEIKMTMLKLLRRFRVEWPSGEKVEPIQKLTNFPDKKLVFKFIDV